MLKREAAEIILLESIRMTELVESILSLTKMDNQELELHLTEIDLVEFIDQCLEALRGIRFSCTIHFESEEQELFVETDSNLLERILRNIISNSLRYAKSHIVIQVKRTYFGTGKPALACHLCGPASVILEEVFRREIWMRLRRGHITL